jgi:hypothetical protein
MNRFTQTLLFALISSLSFALLAEEVQPKHLEQINALQRRADTLAFGELGSNNYHLAKARAWLNMATSEYHQVDTSGAMFGAMTQAETIDQKQSQLRLWSTSACRSGSAVDLGRT